ncbi:hypothetical protein [Rummeliibacillus pycnus]|uniref:hypothetical protein n=1 Tax=Rummeliibacillus pycnus TaxID=101070 RepID=UPI0037C8B315
MRNIVAIIMFLLLVNGCSNPKEKELDIKSKNITIQIVDHQNNEQRYSLKITTNGKAFKDKAVLPIEKKLITNKQKQAQVNLNVGVLYTITVHKTNARSIQELYNKTKAVQLVVEEAPSTTLELTPDIELNKMIIEVD